MKKQYLVFALLIYCFQGWSQLNRGRMMVGLGFNYNQAKNLRTDTMGISYVSNTSMNVSGNLRFGIFVTDNWMIGAFAGATSATSNSTHSHSDYGTASFGLFSRYYRMLGKSRFAVFGQLAISYEEGNGRLDPVNPAYTKYKTLAFSLMVNAGVVYFLSNRFALEASFGSAGFSSLSTAYYDVHNRIVNETDNVGFNSNLSVSLSSLSFGFSFYFGQPKSKEFTPAH